MLLSLIMVPNIAISEFTVVCVLFSVATAVICVASLVFVALALLLILWLLKLLYSM